MVGDIPEQGCRTRGGGFWRCSQAQTWHKRPLRAPCQRRGIIEGLFSLPPSHCGSEKMTHSSATFSFFPFPHSFIRKKIKIVHDLFSSFCENYGWDLFLTLILPEEHANSICKKKGRIHCAEKRSWIVTVWKKNKKKPCVLHKIIWTQRRSDL